MRRSLLFGLLAMLTPLSPTAAATCQTTGCTSAVLDYSDDAEITTFFFVVSFVNFEHVGNITIATLRGETVPATERELSFIIGRTNEHEAYMHARTGVFLHAVLDSPGGMCLNDEITGPPYLIPCWFRGPDPGELIRPIFP